MPKILIVDDSETLRIELRETLVAGGYEVIEGEDGNDGFEKAKAHTDAAMILADYNMPGMDGISMIKKIKAEIPQYANVPCGMLTTEASKELKAKGKEAGVVVWFVKPFDPDKLLKTLEKVNEKFAAA